MLNYRPLSLINIICKIIEKIIKKRVVEHLERNELIHDNQHGIGKKNLI